MLHALGMDLIRGRGDFVDLAALEQTADDRIAFAPIMSEVRMIDARPWRPQRLQTTHDKLPARRAGYSNCLTIP